MVLLLLVASVSTVLVPTAAANGWTADGCEKTSSGTAVGCTTEIRCYLTVCEVKAWLTVSASGGITLEVAGEHATAQCAEDLASYCRGEQLLTVAEGTHKFACAATKAAVLGSSLTVYCDYGVI